MILPILSYGHDILKNPCEPVATNRPDLYPLIDNMWETMYNAKGCGLAAPQVNHPLQLFIVDSKSAFESLKPAEREFYFGKEDRGIVSTFINANIVHRSAETWEELEGCLSVPNIARPVTRSMSITIEYSDQEFVRHLKTFTGTTARIVQHEYDHTQGKLFLDYLKPVSRKMLRPKLRKISTGLLPARYLMTYTQ
ncbi:peptide deformylase [Flavitalea antarctica]